MSTVTTTKTKLISEIKTEKLISYTLVHDQVETNFKLISEALSLNEEEIGALKLTNQKLSSRLGEVEKLLA